MAVTDIYLEECEGRLRLNDADMQALLIASRRPGGLPLVRVSPLPA